MQYLALAQPVEGMGGDWGDWGVSLGVSTAGVKGLGILADSVLGMSAGLTIGPSLVHCGVQRHTTRRVKVHGRNVQVVSRHSSRAMCVQDALRHRPALDTQPSSLVVWECAVEGLVCC